jgi:hypothetical protein
MKARLCIIAAVSVFSAMLLSSAQAPAQKRSVYRGKTAQKRPIQIAASPRQITPIRFKARMLCRDGSLLFGDLSDFEPTPLTSTGRFTDIQHGHTDTVIWRGRVTGQKLSGILRVKDRLPSGVRCDSGLVRFSAKQAGR